jgi:hypothetical protein
MIFSKTSWFDLIGTDIVKHITAAGTAVSANINCKNVPIYLKLSVKIVVTFGGSPDNIVQANLYGVDSNVNESDTVAIWSQKIDPVISSDAIITIPNIDVMTIDTVKVEIKNNDSIDPVSVWVSYFAAYNQ